MSDHRIHETFFAPTTYNSETATETTVQSVQRDGKTGTSFQVFASVDKTGNANVAHCQQFGENKL
eukprot:6473308-Amphidinium_carterae.2